MAGSEFLFFDVILLAPVVILGNVIIDIDLEADHVALLLAVAATLTEDVQQKHQDYAPDYKAIDIISFAHAYRATSRSTEERGLASRIASPSLDSCDDALADFTIFRISNFFLRSALKGSLPVSAGRELLLELRFFSISLSPHFGLALTSAMI